MANELSPVYNITVGTPGSFTNDASISISAMVNAEIDSAPVGDQINIFFNPGIYGEDAPILLPSNTNVIGDNATLAWDTSSGLRPNGALLANADTYDYNGQRFYNNTNGTQTVTPYNPNSTISFPPGSSSPIVDTNISVSGLTFNCTGSSQYTNQKNTMFGTWFINATNIDVQNNVYIGGQDGNAFTNVVNCVVAENIAVGQTNAAYDNWNGPTNVTIENNSAFMGDASSGSWAVLLNSTPTGDPANPGNAVNDGIINNLFSSNQVGSSATNADALLSYGFTTEDFITQQGNIDSTLESPNPQGFYSANVNGENVVDNLVSGVVVTSGYQTNVLSILSGSNSQQSDMSTNSDASGNLIFGAYNVSSGGASIINEGDSPVTVNNAVVGQNSAIATAGFNSTATSAGNITSTNGVLIGTGASVGLGIEAPSTVLVNSQSFSSVQNVKICGVDAGENLSVTLSVHFGQLLVPVISDSVSYSAVGGEQIIIVNGSVSEVNASLQGMRYESNTGGWDDSIEVNVSGSSGAAASRYISLLNINNNPENSAVTYIPAGLINPTPQDTGLFVGQNIPDAPTLSGGIAIANSGNNLITMGNTLSLAFLGTGNNTIQGGSNQEYIATGSGDAVLDLINGGDITVAGGSGNLQVNAITGDDLIETGSANASISGGSGAETILGGVGQLNFEGGSGLEYLATLPQDGGNITAYLGNGNATVLALSGNVEVVSKVSTTNIIYFGLGNDSLNSSGNDVIHTGSGSDVVNALPGGTDSIYGGSGGLFFDGGSGAAWIAPASSTNIQAGAGNLMVTAGGAFNLEITSLDGASRTIILPGLSDGVQLIGFNVQPIVSETLVGTTLNIVLSDNTRIQLADLDGNAVNSTDGFLAFSSSSIVPGALTVNVDGISGVSNNGSEDDSSAINAAFANAAPGTLVDLDFGSGTYYLQGTLDSAWNTTLVGSQTTIVTGSAAENLTFGSGDFTVEGGSGGLVANAAIGNNLFEGGSGRSDYLLGAGSDTVMSGFGEISVTGGSGQVCINSPLQGAAGMDVSLGSGGGIIYALSGQNVIQTDANSNDTVVGNSGSILVQSSGNDVIYAGNGSDTVNAVPGGADVIYGGSGTLDYLGGSRAAWIAPAAMTTIEAGTADLTITTGGTFYIELTATNDTGRTISLPGLSDGVQLTGFTTQAIASEVLNNSTLTVDLSDGTVLQILDEADEAISANNGLLAFDTSPINAGILFVNVDELFGIDTTGGGNDSSIINSYLATIPSGTPVQLDFGAGTYSLQQNLTANQPPIISENAAVLSFSTFALQSNVNFMSNYGTGLVLTSSDDIVEAGGNSDAGIWTIVGAAAGVDTINSAGSAAEIATSGNDNVVGLEGKSATVLSGGWNDLIASFTGNNIISVSGSANILNSAGSDTIYALQGSSSVDAFFFGSGGGSLLFINQSNQPASIGGGSSLSGGVTVYGGGAGGYYQGGSGGNNSLVGGNGDSATTLIGGGTNNFLSVQGSGSNALFASDGNSTLVAGTGTVNNLFQGASGTSSVVSYGSGVQTFYLGHSGSETVTGSTVLSASNNYYILEDLSTGGGTDVLTNFRPNIDHIFINPFTKADVSIDSVMNVTIQGEASSMLLLSDNTLLKLIGVSFDSSQAAKLIGTTYF